ncbi:glioma pathogenesis-related protein 1-like [Carcharodon carcharias]|uniref:glioma pathogenesis-related protein 1-like n=1 Tax=Carcharodon carcharias TaxID=13397 RepID=UPI001B7DB172|nr:glioma pathogenesis-related protein 1-like [Carcharodon carcharias]
MAIVQVPWFLPALWLPLSLYAPAVRAFIDITDPTFIQDCVNQHNKFRSEVSPPATNMFAMTWDEALAKSAKAWSRTCMFKHNPSLKKKGTVHPTFFPIGENIYISTGRFNVKTAIKRWNDEVFDYDYNTNTCKPKKPCGHYTQLAWAKSYKVGCAVSDCPRGIKSSGLKGPGVIFVCNYAPSAVYEGKMDEPANVAFILAYRQQQSLRRRSHWHRAGQRKEAHPEEQRPSDLRS